MSSVSAHVSAVPNHQTLRNTPLSTRYNVACFGSFGYEFNLADLPGSELAAIKDQVAQYKQWRDVLQNGAFYRLESGNIHKWICVSRDRRRAVALFMQELAVPNMQQERFRAEGLDPDLYYHLYSLPHDVDIRQFGDLVNTVAPIHIKQNSLAHNAIARFYKMKGEEEDMAVSGAVLMNAGVSLAPAYGGTGFNDQTRCFSDYTSRLYFIEAI
jgi:alpha-galactosidase